MFFKNSAQQDLIKARRCYAKVNEQLGRYCADSLVLDAERLAFFAGIHPIVFGYYRMLARTFPYSIYYKMIGSQVVVNAIIDNRRNPTSVEKRFLEKKSGAQAALVARKIFSFGLFYKEGLAKAKPSRQ